MVLSDWSLYLPGYAMEQVNRSVAVSGYPIRTQRKPDDDLDFSVTYADRQRPYHILHIGEGAIEHHTHVCLMAAFMIERIWVEPPPRRYVARTNRHELLPPEHHLGLLEYSRTDDPETLSAAIRLDLLSRLLDYPVQIRVTQAVLEQFPEHAKKVHAYGLAYLNSVQSQPALELSPSLRNKYGSMNQAFGEEIAALIGEPAAAGSRGPQDAFRTEQLREALRRVELPGHRGDRQAINSWARRLNMRFWYTWKRMR